MKRKWTSLLAMVFAVMLCLSCFGITALAAETQTQYGLEATIATDKEAYTANEEIHVTVTVKNTNDFEVKDVSIESLIPETLKLERGADSTKTVDLEPSETLTLSFTASKAGKETTDGTKPGNEVAQTETPSQDTNSLTTITANQPTTALAGKVQEASDNSQTNEVSLPQTGESVRNIVIVVVLLFASITIVALCLIKFKKKTNRIISLVMCVAISASAITGVTFFTARSANDNRQSFTVKKVITVDGKDSEVLSTVYYESKQENPDIAIERFVADISDILVGKETDVIFEATITGSGKSGVKQVMVSDHHIELGSLYDDGKSPDKIAGDGIYTGSLTLYSTSRGSVDYYASVGTISKTYSIFYYTEITDDEFEQFDQLLDDLNELEEKNKDKTHQEILDVVENYLKQSDIIESYSRGPESIYFITRSGFQSQFDFPLPKGYRGTDRISQKLTPTFLSNATDAIDYPTMPNLKIAVLRPYMNIDDEMTTTAKNADPIAELIGGEAETYDGQNAGYERFKQLNGYGMVIIDSHGNFIAEKEQPVIMSTERYNKKVHSADYQAGRIYIDKSTKCIEFGPLFFTHYYADNQGLSNSFIYLGSCWGLRTNWLASGFLSGGARTVLGYSAPVSFAYEAQMFNTIFNQLLGYKTLGEAISTAKRENGDHDPRSSENGNGYQYNGERLFAELRCVGKENYLNWKLPASDYGNTCSNILNGGNVVSDGTYHYFSNWDGYIYKQKIGEPLESAQNLNYHGYSLNLNGNRLYFLSGNQLVSMKTDGSDLKILDNDTDAYRLLIYKNELYLEENGSIIRKNKEGKIIQRYTNPGWTFVICNDYIYFCNDYDDATHSTPIYKVNISGGNPIKVVNARETSQDGFFFTVENDWIYYTDYEDFENGNYTPCLKKAKVDGSENHVIIRNTSGVVNVTPSDRIYYIGSGINSTDLEGNDKKLVCSKGDSYGGSICVADDWIYGQYGLSGILVQYRVKTDGTQYEEMFNGILPGGNNEP